ncbi:MAG: hypothetical protein K9N48_06605 [Verrucomicrobia bacterium]|nr:hypothetical protein [Verrucomicrobiota bacterium]MCF7709005.1 hypothetical protein [Verrucomicrobiota bacterium]
MTVGGWITMLLSVGFVTGFFAWCVYKVLVIKRPSEDFHGMDIDTRDTDSDD